MRERRAARHGDGAAACGRRGLSSAPTILGAVSSSWFVSGDGLDAARAVLMIVGSTHGVGGLGEFGGDVWRDLGTCLGVCLCLELFWNTKITSKGLLSVCRFCNENLKVLNLSGCVQLDDEGVRDISKCLKLRYLDLTRVPKMTNVSLASIVTFCRELEFLSLYANSQLTDKAFERIDGLKNLKVFDACGFNKLTDTTLLKLPNTLRYLNLSWCGSIRDEGVCYVAENCRFLELLSVHGNRNVTEKLITSLKIGQKESKSLRILDIKGCLNVKTNTLEALREFFPNLQSIKFHT